MTPCATLPGAKMKEPVTVGGVVTVTLADAVPLLPKLEGCAPVVVTAVPTVRPSTSKVTVQLVPVLSVPPE